MTPTEFPALSEKVLLLAKGGEAETGSAIISELLETCCEALE
jgi:hypothetical protein